MIDIKKAAAVITSAREGVAKDTLWALVDALDQGREFDLTRLYQLNYPEFETAMALIVDWRFRRHTQPVGGLRPLIENGGRTDLYPM